MDTAKLKEEALALRREKHQMIKTDLNAAVESNHDLAIVYTQVYPLRASRSKTMKTCPWN